MFDFPRKPDEILSVDLHEMRVSEAKKWLYDKVSGAPKQIKEIEVVHGFHGGTALQNMVRRSFKHPRVEKIVVGMNPGTTTLLLKQAGK